MSGKNLNECEKLAELSVKGWSYEKLEKREKLCYEALAAKGVVAFVTDNRETRVNQLRSMYEYLLERALIHPTETTDLTLKAAELTSLLIRIKRRYEFLDKIDRSILRHSDDPIFKALVETAEEGVLHYPPSHRQKLKDQLQRMRKSKHNISDDLNKCKEAQKYHKIRLADLEGLEEDAQTLRKKRAELLKEIRQCKTDDKRGKACLSQMAELEIEDKKLRKKRKELLAELKDCRKNEEEGYKSIKLLEKAKKRLEACTVEKNQLKKENDVLLATKGEYEDTMCALATEVQKTRIENYYLQEVILELQNTPVGPSPPVAPVGQAAIQSQQVNQQGFLQQKLQEDKATLQKRIAEAQQLRSEWDKLIQTPQFSSPQAAM